MHKHIYFETLDNELNFFDVQSFDYSNETKCFIVVTQNNEVNYIPRATIKRIVL